MNQSRTSSKLFGLCVLVLSFVLVGADLVALAQNSNSNTTPTDDSMQNSNMEGHMGHRRRRRGTRRMRSGNANMAGDMAGESGNANMAGDTSMQEPAADMAEHSGNMNMGQMTGGRRRRRGRRRMAMPHDMSGTTMPADTSGAGMMEATGGTQGGGGMLGRVGDPTGLDGTYTGMVNYPDGSMSGDATLTINGSSFTLSGGGAEQQGTLTAQTWPGYTAVSMRFGDSMPATIISLRGWHNGNSLRLESVRGEAHSFSFHGTGAGGGMMHGGRRRRRSTRRGGHMHMHHTASVGANHSATPAQ